MVASHCVRALFALVTSCCLVVGRAAAEPEGCAAARSRQEVVSCALRASPAVYAELRGLDAVAGRRVSASVVLPSNPTISGTLGLRTSSAEGRGLDWYASLSQELEIAGQRGARLDVVAAEGDAQRARVTAAERDAAAAALAA